MQKGGRHEPNSKNDETMGKTHPFYETERQLLSYLSARITHLTKKMTIELTMLVAQRSSYSNPSSSEFFLR